MYYIAPHGAPGEPINGSWAFDHEEAFQLASTFAKRRRERLDVWDDVKHVVVASYDANGTSVPIH